MDGRILLLVVVALGLLLLRPQLRERIDDVVLRCSDTTGFEYDAERNRYYCAEDKRVVTGGCPAGFTVDPTTPTLCRNAAGQTQANPYQCPETFSPYGETECIQFLPSSCPAGTRELPLESKEGVKSIGCVPSSMESYGVMTATETAWPCESDLDYKVVGLTGQSTQCVRRGPAAASGSGPSVSAPPIAPERPESQGGSTIVVPRQLTSEEERAGILPYDDAEADRIFNLSQTAKAQMISRMQQEAPANAEVWARAILVGLVSGFYTNVYSTLSRPIQESDITSAVDSMPDRIALPDQKEGIKDLLRKYFMGPAASQGPKPRKPLSYPELSAAYQTKLAEYQTRVATALASNNAAALPAIRTLNAEITQLLEDMLTSLDPLRQDTDVTRRQREELVAVLAQLERDSVGLKATSDSMGRLRRIRDLQRGVTEHDLKLYGVLFAAGCLAVFVIAMTKS